MLVAGGDTWIATVRFAQQLQRAGCPSKLVYLDLSEESRRIAERRVQSFSLDNIDFNTKSLIDLASSGLGIFDYIDCGGVLHHLKEPAAGLTALTEVMAAEGGMGLMVYGPNGRAGTYSIQEMMRRPGAGNQSDQLPLLKNVLDGLPATNLLHHHERFRQGYGEYDAELVDLFLHPVDRPFTVPQLTQLCERAGLRVVRFLPTAKCESASYIGVAEILRRVSELEWLERAALAELLSGNMHMHFFFAVSSKNFEEGIVDFERPDIADFVPVLSDIDGAVLAENLSESNDFA